MTARHLHAVETPPPLDPQPEEADVTMLLRAEIAKRDWGKVHVEADKRRPFERLRRVVLGG